MKRLSRDRWGKVLDDKWYFKKVMLGKIFLNGVCIMDKGEVLLFGSKKFLALAAFVLYKITQGSVFCWNFGECEGVMQETKEFLTVREVATFLGSSVSSVWLWSRSGFLPAPIRVAPKTLRWRASQIMALFEMKGKDESCA